MGKSPLILAALAKDAVPSLNLTKVEPLGSPYGGYESVLLTADNQNQVEHYVLKMARTQNSGIALDTEITALRAFNPALRERLPFEISHVVGETRDERSKRALVFSFVYGTPIDLSNLSPEHPLVASVAKSIAAIHSLPTSLVENAGLPEYTPSDVVRMRTNELDRAAETGRVPSVLLTRWETALSDVSLFKFLPTVVHGELNGDHMLESEGEVSGVLNWGSLRISDPADDFAWICGSQNADVIYNLINEYESIRGNHDTTLRQRSQLYSELEYARWLLHCIRVGNEPDTEEAAELLRQLASDIEDEQFPKLNSAPIAAVTQAQFEDVTPAFTSTAAMPVVEELAAPEVGIESFFEEEAVYENTDTAVVAEVAQEDETLEEQKEPLPPFLQEPKDDELF